MVLFRSLFFGEVRKSIGNVTTYSGAKGYSVGRTRRMKIRNPKTPGQLRQRAKMKELLRLSLYFAPAAELGFPGRTAGTSCYNAFVKENMGAITATESESGEVVATVNYDQVVCASGYLTSLANVEVTVDTAAKKVNVTQEAQTYWSAVANPNDVLYVAMYEKEKQEMVVTGCRNRKESGSTSIALGKNWAVENLVIYAFMLSKDKRKASRSIVLQPTSNE
ncbi:DUF6266 family protein [Butyricimonas sp. Marseille-P3923]|uniref:DUF6266 family protein n=1 Tax=Butyricimonas sp. Marseille-P3923 TaxID=1987504 RepID=UPI000C07D204|nr:DUF6266 family protein [Butyricimonas sp. Marseille-P3923]